MSSRSRFFGAIPAGRGFEVRVERTTFRQRPRIDIRLHYEYRIGDPDSARPTKKGIAIELRHLPRLRQLLEAAERDAVEAGLLRPHHYERAGVEPLPGGKLSEES